MASPYLARPLRTMDQARADIERRRIAEIAGAIVAIERRHQHVRPADLLAIGFSPADLARHLFAAASQARRLRR